MKAVGLLVALGIAGVIPTTLRAQTDSGPGVGSKVEALKVFMVTGDSAGKQVDVVADRKDKPTVYIFVQADKWDRPAARFVKTLDQELVKGGQAVAAVAAVAVWLTDDAGKAKDYLPKAQESLKLERTALAVCEGERAGPNGWGVNADAHVTVVVVRGGEAVASFGYKSLNETDVPDVMKAVKKK